MSLRKLSASGVHPTSPPNLTLVPGTPSPRVHARSLRDITLFPSVYNGLDTDQQEALSIFAEDQRASLKGGRIKDIAREGAVRLEGHQVQVKADLLSVVQNPNWLEPQTVLRAQELGNGKAVNESLLDASLRDGVAELHPSSTVTAELNAQGLSRAVEHGLTSVIASHRGDVRDLFHPDYLNSEGFPAVDAAVLRLAHLLALTCEKPVAEILESAPFKDCISPVRRAMLQHFERVGVYGMR